MVLLGFSLAFCLSLCPISIQPVSQHFNDAVV